MVKRFVTSVPSTQAVAPHLLETEYAAASFCGAIRVSVHFLFLPGPFKVRYIPLETIVRGYMRIEDGCVSAGCRRATIPIYFLVIVTNDQKRHKISMDSDTDVRAVLVSLQLHAPTIAIGYSN